MLALTLGILLQTAAVAIAPPVVADSAGPTLPRLVPHWDQSRLLDAMDDTLRRRRRIPSIEYSQNYYTRAKIHRVLSYAMVPLFIGSAYTGFELRNKKDQAPQWTKDIHGPLAAGTAVVFGMNTLTGVWNLLEGRKDPADRGRKLLHSALFLAAAAGFTYVTVAGDNIHEYGKANPWHRNVALASMTVSVVSWSIMLFH